MLSASHNPYQDNGIKFFGGDGYKLSDEAELEIERGARGAAPRRHAGAIGRVRELHGAGEDYLRELHTRFAELDLSGLDVLLDCANGATYRVAPEIFRGSARSVTVHADSPDGRNINDGCGSTHVDELARTVVEGGHAIGFAFDGDGDRVLAVDSRGAVVDGDELLALAAAAPAPRGRLPRRRRGVTVMTNYGFHAAMEREGIEVAVTAVGDRYVLEELRARGWTLGGEQSGHLIEMGFNRTGDGIAGALLTLEALGGARPGRARTRWRSCRSGSSTCACATAARSPAPSACTRPSRDAEARARRARTRADPPERHRAARAGDGRGAHRGGGGRALHAAGRAGGVRARRGLTFVRSEVEAE